MSLIQLQPIASFFAEEFLSGDFLYRDALLTSRDDGIEASLACAEAVDFDILKQHHNSLHTNHEISMECLFSGNVSSTEAETFFGKAHDQIKKYHKREISSAETSTPYVPGRFGVSCAILCRKIGLIIYLSSPPS